MTLQNSTPLWVLPLPLELKSHNLHNIVNIDQVKQIDSHSTLYSIKLLYFVGEVADDGDVSPRPLLARLRPRPPRPAHQIPIMLWGQ